MSHVISNRLESLSNELLLDIFEYLDAYKLFQAFYGLNHRIDSLLQSTHLHILVDLTNQDKTVWNTLTSFINSSQIHRLTYEGDIIDEQLLHFIKENLHCLCLRTMSKTSIKKIVRHIPTNNHIKCFYIKERYGYNIQGNRGFLEFLFIDHGHRFTSLVNLSLSFDIYNANFPNVSIIFPQLRRLSINHCYWASSLCRFLRDKTPNLRSLHFEGSFLSWNQLPQFVFKQIHELHINHSAEFSNLQSILCMFPRLRRLHVHCENLGWCAVANGTQWQAIIENYLPHLKQLTIDFNEGMDEEILKTFYTGEFWLTKKVNVKMIIDRTQSQYRPVKTIYFGRQWKFVYFRDF